MLTTRATLLQRLKRRSDSGSWRDFIKLYAPLLYRYARQRGLSVADAEEIRDRCLEVMVAKLPEFQYARGRRGFKNWLRQIVTRKVIDLQRKQREREADSVELSALKDSSPSPAEIWEKNWHDAHLKFCVDRVRGKVTDIHFLAFRMVALEGVRADEVASRLNLTTN